MRCEAHTAPDRTHGLTCSVAGIILLLNSSKATSSSTFVLQIAVEIPGAS